MINSSRTSLTLLGFAAIGATVHCSSTQDGEVGVDNVASADAGGGVSIAASCATGSANQTGCACAQGQTVACYTGPASTRDVGSCKDGTQTCTAGALVVRSLRLDDLQPGDVTDGYGYGPCTGEVTPTATATCGGNGSDGGGSSTGDGGTTTTPPASCPTPLTQWVPISTVGAPGRAAGTPLVWTGTEVAMYGGTDGSNNNVSGGFLYNPATDTWRPMSTTGQPGDRAAPAIWTGSRFLMWGGSTASNNGGTVVVHDDGALYDPASDTWEAIPSPASTGLSEGPSGGDRQLGWNGTELVIFGNAGRDGWFYNPTTKTYRAFGGGLGVIGPSVQGTPSIQIWTGSEAVIWGETMNPGTTSILATYTDAAGTWTQHAMSPLSARESADYALVGDQIFVHGGRPLEPPYDFDTDGAMYNTTSDTWTMLPAGGDSRGFALTTYTGCDVLEVGGIGDVSALSGMRYTPSTQTWTTLPALPERYLGLTQGGVWTGEQLVLYASGGNDVGSLFAYRLVP